MRQLGVVYEFTDVDLLDGNDKLHAINQLRKLNPQLSFPTIIIGERIIVGNRQDDIKEALELS
jgi:glutaredoxin